MAVSLLIVGVCAVTFVLYSHFSQKFLTVAFLDVGQGDSIFIEAPNGNQILIDAGPSSATVRQMFSLLPFYDRSINAVLATHSDADHVAGIPAVFSRFSVGNYITSIKADDDALYQETEKMAEQHKINRFFVGAGDRIIIDEGRQIYLDIIWPYNASTIAENNDASIVARLVYGDVSFLLAGDASVGVERQILSVSGPEIQSSVLKVGHHGSKTSSDPTFIMAVAPTYSVVSAGIDNKFGHPHADVIATLHAANTKILETSASSTIVFQTDGENLFVR